MRIIAIRNDKTAIFIGTDQTDAKWYGTGPIKNYIKDLQKNDEVEIRYRTNEQQKLELSFIKKVYNGNGKLPQVEQEYQSDKDVMVENPTPSTSGPGQPKTFEEKRSESICRQAIGKMVATTISGLEGVDVNNVYDMIDKLFEKYQQKVK